MENSFVVELAGLEEVCETFDKFQSINKNPFQSQLQLISESFDQIEMSEDGTAYITSGIRRPNNVIPPDEMDLPRLTPIIKLRQSMQTNAQKEKVEEIIESESEYDDNMEVEYLDQDEEFVHPSQEEEEEEDEEIKQEIEVQQSIKLPVKKRISLGKTPVKPVVPKLDPVSYLACQICGVSTTNQESFFAHLKTHYEPAAETVVPVRPVSRSPSYESIEIKVSFFHTETIC